MHQSPAKPRVRRSKSQGFPYRPQDVVFMKMPAEEAAKKGVAMVNLVASSGGNVRDGLIFDIGCGYGRFAYGLLQTGFEGRYIGMDIVEHRIDWLRENFTPRQPRYHFHFVDVKNSHYNPDGSQKETSYADILGDDRPDTIVLFSVFTHMYLEDIEAHLVRIAEVMSPSTKLFFSCFLFDGIAQEGIKAGTARRQFPYELSPDCRYDRKKEPLKAIAFREATIQRALEKVGLTGEVRRGSLEWRRIAFSGFGKPGLDHSSEGRFLIGGRSQTTLAGVSSNLASLGHAKAFSHGED